MSGGWRVESREQGAVNREQGTGDRGQGTGNREQGTGSREQGTGNRGQGTGDRMWETVKAGGKDEKFSVPSCSLHIFGV